MGGEKEPMQPTTLPVFRSARMSSGRKCPLRHATKSGAQAISLEGKFDISQAKAE